MEHNRFAWFPIRVTSGQLVWLSNYIEHINLFDATTGRPPLRSMDFRWTETYEERTWRLLKERTIQNRNVWNDTLLANQDKL